MTDEAVSLAIQVSYYVAAFLFIMGLKRMSSPVTAASGIKWAGVGMVVATIITFAYPDMNNYVLMTTAIFVGGILAWWTGKRVEMTDMPQMIALYNGMGGGAAAAIAAVELLHLRGGHEAVPTEGMTVLLTLAIAGAGPSGPGNLRRLPPSARNGPGAVAAHRESSVVTGRAIV